MQMLTSLVSLMFFVLALLLLVFLWDVNTNTVFQKRAWDDSSAPAISR